MNRMEPEKKAKRPASTRVSEVERQPRKEANDLVVRLTLAVETEERKSGNKKRKRHKPAHRTPSRGRSVPGRSIAGCRFEGCGRHGLSVLKRRIRSRRDGLLSHLREHRGDVWIGAALLNTPWAVGISSGTPLLRLLPLSVPNGGYASRFKATDELIQFCVNMGVDPEEARKHFVDPLPESTPWS